MSTKKTVKTAVKQALVAAAKVVAAPEITVIAKEAAKNMAAGRKPVGAVSAKEATLAVFQAAPDKEFKTDEVVAAVTKTLPKSKRETILWMMTELKKAGSIHRVRNDGHQHVLKLGAGSGVASKPKAVVVGAGDLASVLRQLTKLVEQRAQIDAEIERLKKLI